MPLLDASLVTQALVTLITQSVLASPEAAKVAVLNVSPLSPDRLTGDHTIGLYLYYITENAQYKNPPPAISGNDFPERFTPMGLDFHYILTAHSELPGDAGALQEQILMGLGMKTLHDFPLIDDTTQVSGVTIFPLDLLGAGNLFRITLQPVPVTEAMGYWNAGTQALRLAAYYQVTPVLLQPAQPDSLNGRVLTYGVFTFARGAPRLDTSQNLVSFTVPGETTPRTVTVQPAEVAVGGTVTFLGSGLSGDHTTLLLNNRLFPQPIQVSLDWGVSATDSQITAVIQSKAQLRTILPGVYSARASVSTQKRISDGSLRTFVNSSNEIPFVIVPTILGFSVPALDGTITVTGGVFQDAGIPADAVQVFLGSTLVTPKAAALLNPGEFEVFSPSTLNFRFPASGFVSGAFTPFRLIISGAENSPVWVKVP
jgi:hypothetical protein